MSEFRASEILKTEYRKRLQRYQSTKKQFEELNAVYLDSANNVDFNKLTNDGMLNKFTYGKQGIYINQVKLMLIEDYIKRYGGSEIVPVCPGSIDAVVPNIIDGYAILKDGTMSPENPDPKIVIGDEKINIKGQTIPQTINTYKTSLEHIIIRELGEGLSEFERANVIKEICIKAYKGNLDLIKEISNSNIKQK